MMYQMLAGQPPFVSEGLGELVLKHMTEAPRPLRESVPGLSAGLEGLVHAMLAKDPAQRPSMAQVLGEIEQLGRSLAGWASTLRPADGSLPAGSSFPTGSSGFPVPHPSTLGQAAGQRQPSWLVASLAGNAAGAARTRALIISAAAGLLVVGLVVAVMPKRDRGTTPAEPRAGMLANPVTGQGMARGALTNNLPNGMTITSGRVDPSHIDVAAFYKMALDEARQRAPDAELTTLVARCVQPNGIANLNLCSGAVMMSFRSAAKSVRGNTPIGVAIPCLVQVIAQPSIGLLVQNGSSERCDEKVMKAPRCLPAEIWSRARKAGAPENAIGDLALIDGKWYLTIDGNTHQFPDNC